MAAYLLHYCVLSPSTQLANVPFPEGKSGPAGGSAHFTPPRILLPALSFVAIHPTIAGMTADNATPDPLDLAYSDAVKQAQLERGSRNAMARGRLGTSWFDTANDDLARFLAERDHFFLGTASADGQPYIQHRGGPPGFLKVLDAKTLGFADFSGNKQYISVGNLSENPRAFLFVIDYALQRRIKLWGRAEVVEGDAVLLQKLMPPGYQARPERAILFHLDLWAINCPQHIRQRVTADEIAPVLARYEARIEELEAEVKKLRQG